MNIFNMVLKQFCILKLLLHRYVKEGDTGTLVPELIYGCLWKQKYDVIVEKLTVEFKFLNNLL